MAYLVYYGGTYGIAQIAASAAEQLIERVQRIHRKGSSSVPGRDRSIAWAYVPGVGTVRALALFPGESQAEAYAEGLPSLNEFGGTLKETT